MIIEKTNSLEIYLQGTIKRKKRENISPSLSALFRNARKKNYVEHIGDYPIFTKCLQIANQSGIEYSHQQISYALRQSWELSSEAKQIKTEIINNLLKMQACRLQRKEEI